MQCIHMQKVNLTRKKRKMLLLFLICFVSVMSFAGCGKKNDKNTTQMSQMVEQSAEQAVDQTADENPTQSDVSLEPSQTEQGLSGATSIKEPVGDEEVSDNPMQQISKEDIQNEVSSAEVMEEPRAIESAPAEELQVEDDQDDRLDPDGTYTSKEDVALYIHLYGELPQNFITKKEAQNLGWSGGSLEKYAPGKCIGGSKFGNYEEQLPDADGRRYYECDIDTLGAKSRGAKRIVYSNDGLIYYTDDHYETFELLYGEE